MKRTNGKPIWDSYADIPDLAVPCPNCGAVDTWCTKPDGRVRRVPCIARLTTEAVGISEFRDTDRLATHTTEENT